MGRRKLKENGNGKLERKYPMLEGDTKRSIVAVFLLALALISVLSLFNAAGLVGVYLNRVLALAFGWGRFLLPLLMVVMGVMYFKKEYEANYVYIASGFAIFLASLLGIFHIFYPLDQMIDLAKQGTAGGFLGAAVAYPALKLFGFVAGIIILAAFVIASILLAFNIPLRALALGIMERFRKPSQEEFDIKEIKERETEPAEPVSGEKFKISSVLRRTPRESVTAKRIATVKPSGSGWKLPPLDLLERTTGAPKGGDVQANAKIIQKTLGNFGIEVEPGEINVGPSVTQYSFRPAEGVKLSRITALQNNLALALAAHPIRIEAPIPGKSLIGIEVPNKSSALVRLRSVLESREFSERKSNLTLALGQDVAGKFVTDDLSEMPHLMIAGATGTGKSICINSIITALIYQNSPDDLKLILIDPKRVELTAFDGISHLLTPTVVENGKVVNALRWAIGEMERRYHLLQENGSRDIFSYNSKIKEGKVRKSTDEETGEVVEEEVKRLPYIVIIIDELADIMAGHAKDVEAAIVRIAQMARAVGIHLIVSTQRPSVEVLTGLIKANITTRIAFQVATQIDSRTILDMAGSEKLLGNGDMLYLNAKSAKPKRIQGVFISESEIKKVVKFVRRQNKGEVEYDEEVTAPQKSIPGIRWSGGEGSEGEEELYEEAKDIVIKSGKASASLLQRRLRVGYARAARLLDMLEENGIIGPADGSKPREILVSKHDGERPGVDYKDSLEDQQVRDSWRM